MWHRVLELRALLHSLLGSFALADVPPQEEEEEEGFLALIPDLMSYTS